MEQKMFPELVKEVLKQINAIRQNSIFYERLGRSRSVVSNWRNGRVGASTVDQVKFIETANTVIREYKEKSQVDESRQKAALMEFHSLISAQL